MLHYIWYVICKYIFDLIPKLTLSMEQFPFRNSVSNYSTTNYSNSLIARTHNQL